MLFFIKKLSKKLISRWIINQIREVSYSYVYKG